MQRFRGGLVFKARRLCVLLNSRLESDLECGDARVPSQACPHGGLRTFHQKSTCLTQLTLGPNLVQIWSRNTLELRRTSRAVTPGCVAATHCAVFFTMLYACFQKPVYSFIAFYLLIAKKIVYCQKNRFFVYCQNVYLCIALYVCFQKTVYSFIVFHTQARFDRCFGVMCCNVLGNLEAYEPLRRVLHHPLGGVRGCRWFGFSIVTLPNLHHTRP